jgi:hypothetical protein
MLAPTSARRERWRKGQIMAYLNKVFSTGSAVTILGRVGFRKLGERLVILI